MKQKFLNVMLTVFLLSVVSAGCNLFEKDESNSPTASTTDGGTTTTGTVTASDQNDVEQALSSDDLFTQEMSDMLNEGEDAMEMASTDY